VKTHTRAILALAQKIKLIRKPRRRSRITDEMRLFVVSVASVAFSRQKVGNASDANRRSAQTCNNFNTKKNKKTFLTDYQPPEVVTS
jgi:hypothetical protein